LLNIYPAKSEASFFQHSNKTSQPVEKEIADDSLDRLPWLQQQLWINVFFYNRKKQVSILQLDNGARLDIERKIDKRSASYEIVLCYSNETALPPSTHGQLLDCLTQSMLV